MRAQSVVRRRLKALLLVLVTVFLLSMTAQAARRPVHRSAAGELSIKAAFAQSGTDKLTRHGYHRFYDQFLQPLYGQPVRMLEVGVLGGDSLHAWQTVFDAPRSTIYGVGWPAADNVRTGGLHDNVHIMFRDQSNCGHLDDVANTVGPDPLDLVIDDGSHIPEHQLGEQASCSPLACSSRGRPPWCPSWARPPSSRLAWEWGATYLMTRPSVPFPWDV